MISPLAIGRLRDALRAAERDGARVALIDVDDLRRAIDACEEIRYQRGRYHDLTNALKTIGEAMRQD